MEEIMSGDTKFWVALSRVPQLGTVRFRRLESYFGKLENVWNASFRELKAAGLEDRPARETVAARNNSSPDDEMAALERAGVTAVTWNHSGYPSRLKEIADPPPVLFYKGTLLPEDDRSVAIVGTRSPTTYGREAAAVLSRGLAQAGITVVSGLALGIDGVAHRAALENGGRTIAVLAGGLDRVYPKDHTVLCGQVQEQGAVVSEQPLGVRPDSRSFPRRNRLISGLSLGSVVVEAAEGSGARHTVYHALEQDREVFCVPGSIFSPASDFTNRMIKEGAKLVMGITDILEELNIAEFAPRAQMPQTASIASKKLANVPEQLPFVTADEDEPVELALLSHLNDEPVHIDDIQRLSGLPIPSVSSTLTMLELKGKIKQVGCMHYIRIRESTAVYDN
ncbi:MAG: DNA-processing protein DprA [Chloroflexi bacterium]|nr:DNA-protecting protein DprA [Chloroflexota bacterium]MCI0903196.1 DNA-processing protein DprA [Chloroflexota bacterium]